MHGVFAGSNQRPRLRLFDSPVRERARIASAKSGLFPDVRVLGWRGSKRYKMRRLHVQVPPNAIQAFATRRPQFPNYLIPRVENLNLDGALRAGFESVVEPGAASRHQPVRLARREESHRDVALFGRHLLERRDVVENVDAAPIGGNHEIVELLLNHGPRNRRVRQTAGQRGPMPAVVDRIVQAVAGSRKQQSFLVRILGDYAHITELMFRQSAIDASPGLSEVRGLIDKRIAVVGQMQIHRDVSGPGVEGRRLDARNAAPFRQTGEVCRKVGPLPAAVLGDPDESIVGAGPYQSLLQCRWRDSKDYLGEELSEIVADDAA